MTPTRIFALACVLALAACDPDGAPVTPSPGLSAGAPQPGGLAPSIRGNDPASVRAYYRGPRGDEF